MFRSSLASALFNSCLGALQARPLRSARWRTLCFPPASCGHVFEPCGSSWCSPLSSCHGRKPRALLLLFVQVCLSCLSTLWARLSPSYSGLVPCYVAMNAIVTQRSKCDIAIGSSHDIYPVSHRFARVTQASGTGVFKHLFPPTAGGLRKVYLHLFPPTLEFSELTPTPAKNADAVWGLCNFFRRSSQALPVFRPVPGHQSRCSRVLSQTLPRKGFLYNSKV